MPRVQFHWPHGRDVEEGEDPYDFDAWVEAVEQGQRGLVSDYIQQGVKLKAQGIELITYLDSLRADADFQRLLDPSEPYAMYRYKDRFDRSVWPGMLCGSVGFDNVTSLYSDDPAMVIGPGHPGYDLLSWVRSSLAWEGDGRCYVEATARNRALWWHDWNQLIINSTFKRRHRVPIHPALKDKKDWWPIFRDGIWIERNKAGEEIREGIYTGEIVRLCPRAIDFEGHEVTRESIIATYKQIAGDGHTFAMRPDVAMGLGVKAEELET